LTFIFFRGVETTNQEHHPGTYFSEHPGTQNAGDWKMGFSHIDDLCEFSRGLCIFLGVTVKGLEGRLMD
jgi:hypothetical protein